MLNAICQEFLVRLRVKANGKVNSFGIIYLWTTCAWAHFITSLFALHLFYFMKGEKSSLFEKISVLMLYFFARIASRLTGFLSSNNSEAI